MLVPNRHEATDGYRYGFNGKELDSELKGEGNSLDFGARMYDSRAGRWFAKDPLQMKYPSMSPYVSFENNPIIFVDPDGKDAIITISGNTITVKTVIYIDNSGINKMNVAQAQSDIMNTWGKNFKDSSGKYNVKFDIIVLEKPSVLYDIVGNITGNLPSINEFGIDSRSTNIVIPQSDDFRSHVTGYGGKYGAKWAVNKRGTEYAHEVGHFFGLADLYDDTFFENVSDKNDPKNGTPGNPVIYDKNSEELMAIGGDNKRGEKAKVTQRSIDAIVEFALQEQVNGEALINLKTVKNGGLAAPTKQEKIEGILSLPSNTTIIKPKK